MDAKLINLLPTPFIKVFAKPYIGGESEDRVIKQAKEVYKENKYLSTLDALGEDVKSQNDINKFVNIYLELIRKVSKLEGFEDNYQKPSVSMKPSCFVISEKLENGKLNLEKMDWKGCYENIHKICSYAKEQNVRVTVEMEDAQWTDFTLDTYFKLLENGFDNVGTVLQTRLFRSKEDIKLFNDKSRVRLVIGIYNEPASIAVTEKRKMKNLMVEFAKILFEKGSYVEFATHDEEYIKKFISEVVIPMNISNDRYEVQMLLGVPREQLKKDLVSGELYKKLSGKNDLEAENVKINIRLYLPFAQTWENAIAYCRRRLIENPNIILYSLKNLF